MLNMGVREMAVCGTFYPAKKGVLEKQLLEFFSKTGKVLESEKTNAIIAPHAGYIYSGQIAAFAFSCLKKCDSYIILCPNHTGYGTPISISDAVEWRTPFGKIEVDKVVGKKIVEKTIAKFDDLAHFGEHAVEVQLPFLQHLFQKNFKIVPIAIALHDLTELKKLGKAIAEIEKEGIESIGVIASSDFTHFEPLDFAKKKDLKAIEKIEKLDVEGFHSMAVGRNLSICGFAGITALLQYCCSKKGFKTGKLLKYGSSATVSGNKMNVVGYAAIKF